MKTPLLLVVNSLIHVQSEARNYTLRVDSLEEKIYRIAKKGSQW